MDTLPIKLNFFKRAEQFLELLRLDQQYKAIMPEWVQIITDRKKDPQSPIKGFVFPTWNLEKKILFWTYKNHRHLGTPFSVSTFEEEQFLKAWHTDVIETKLIGAKQVLENLEAHGFAKSVAIPGPHIVITPNGLLAGSLLFSAYNFKMVNYANDHSWEELLPNARRKVGYQMLYLAAWVLIALSVLFVSLQVLSLMGLLDDVKKWFYVTPLLRPTLTAITLSPIVLVLGGIFLVRPIKQPAEAQ